MNPLLLALNCGSSSIKFALFEASGQRAARQPAWQGQVEGIGSGAPALVLDGAAPHALALGGERAFQEALLAIQARVHEHLQGRALLAVAHRVVHGGGKYVAPARIDPAVLLDLHGYVPLAPLHQPFALAAIELWQRSHPALPQVACFDTAFHHTLPLVEQVLPLPRAFAQRGIRRYGFHGLSYEYQATALLERHGEAARGRLIVAHLGNGASLCAMRDLRSVATTMGFSALDGLMMGTRCGALDAGVLLHLMEVDGLAAADLNRLLYHEAGLLGVSGVSPDPRVLLAQEAGNEQVQLALALYLRRLVHEVGALTAVLGGLDALVFTAGIGEHNAELRLRLCDALGFAGVQLDGAANLAHAPTISSPTSRVRVHVEPTHEEWVLARHALRVLGSGTDGAHAAAPLSTP